MRLDEIVESTKKPTRISGADKYRQTLIDGVNDIVNYRDAQYVPMPKKRKKRNRTTDVAQNSIINTLWHYQSADAS